MDAREERRVGLAGRTCAEPRTAAIELAPQHATFLFCKYCAWIALLEAKFDTVANYRILACTSIVLDFADDTPGKFRSLVSIFPKAPIAAAKPAR